MKNKRKYILHIICAFLAFFCTIGVGYSIWTYDQYVFNDAENELTKAETYAEACVITSSETKYFLKFVNAVDYANAITEEPVEVKALIKQKIGGAYVATTITLKQDLVINENVTLTLPYFNGDDSECVYKKMFADDFDTEVLYDSVSTGGKIDNCYTKFASYSILKLSIASGYTLTNYGRINIGGRQNGANGGSMAGYTYGGKLPSTASTSYGGSTAYFAEIMLNGTAKYESYGTTVCFGFIRGVASGENKPEINFHSGSSSYIPFVVIEHRGGTTFLGLSSLDGSPFNRFFFPNFYNVTTNYLGTSKLFACPDLYASKQNNRTTCNMIGPDSSFMINQIASNDSQFKFTNYYSNKSVTYTSTMDESEKTVTLPRHDLHIYGNFNLNYLTIAISIAKLSTNKCYFPISDYYDIQLSVMPGFANAVVRSPAQKIKVLPGAKLTINENVTAELAGLACYYGEDSGRSRYGLNSFDGIEGNNGCLLYELIDKDGEALINGYAKLNYASGLFTTTSTTSKLEITYNSDTLYEVKPKANSFYSFALSAYGHLYNTEGNTALNSNSTYYGDSDHWDGSGVTYPLVVNNYCTSASFDESNIVNGDYPTSITSSVTLPNPSYTGDSFIFAGYYASTDFVNIINPGTVDAGQLSDGFSTLTHTYTIYARWVDASADKASYRVDTYDGGSTVNHGSETIALVGSEYNSFDIDRRKTTFTDSKIDTYQYDGWKAKVYEDNTEASLKGEIVISNNSFIFENSNYVSNGNFVVFEPIFIHNSYNAPSITVTAAPILSPGASGQLTGVVTNYRDDVFDILALFATEEDDLSIGETSLVSRDGYTVTLQASIKNTLSEGSDDTSATVGLGVILSITIDDILYTSSDASLYKASVDQPYKYSSGCLLSDSVITTKNGEKCAKDVTVDDFVLTFNHFTGQYEYQRIAFVVAYSKEADIVKLTFDDGNTMKIATGHGLFSVERNQYEIYYGEEFKDHIGEHFISTVKQENGFINVPVQLVDVEVTREFVDIYSPITSYNINIVADNMLNIPDDVEGMFDMYEYNSDLSINVQALMPVIAKYGLWSYEDFSDYAPEYAFEVMNFKYIKAALLSGNITVGQVNYLLKVYLPMIVEQNGLDWDCEHQKYLPDDYVQRMLEN